MADAEAGIEKPVVVVVAMILILTLFFGAVGQLFR
jgi:preprotein translocase subunit SecE